MKAVFLSIAAALISGCIGAYKVPETGPTATLYATTDFIFVFADGQCTDPQMAYPAKDKSLKVAAGKPLFIGKKFDTRGLGYGAYCKVLVTFLPEPGGAYETRFLMEGGRCALPVSRVMPTGELKPEASLRSFHHKNCDNPWNQP